MAEENRDMMRIRQAVSEDQQTDPSGQQNFSDMQPSIMGNAQGMPEPPIQEQQQGQGAYQDYGAEGYGQYNDYGGGISADTIAEIAEQTIAERMTKVREILEDAMDFKTTAESKLADLNERLKRIESTIDRLQLSILQKVGEYITNTEDIKKELQENQKSFKALLGKKA